MRRHKIILSLVMILWAASTSAQGDEPAGGMANYLRLARDEHDAPVALEASIVRFTPADRGKRWASVDLVAAVHVGDKTYYRTLNDRFAQYDAVLFELVAPEGTRIPKGGVEPGGNPVSSLQGGLTRLLDLEFQLREVDYTRANMVHADMSPEQFAASMRDRGESMYQTFMRMLGYAMTRQGGSPVGSSDFRMIGALFRKDRALALKRIMAEQFEELDGSLAAINGPEGSTLVSERNKRALEVLRKEIDRGKRKLAIFYGAGHMPDFAERLDKDFGLKPVGTEWVTAWDLK